MTRNHIPSAAFAVLCCAAAFTTQSYAAVGIATQAGLITPSFRDASNTDANNTTFFGWGSGSFDATVDNEIIDNPPANQGIGGRTGTLNQIGTHDILSGGNNIYTAGFTNETLQLQIPVSSTAPIGSGFTTIVLQGHTAFGPFGGSFSFTDIEGVSPEVVYGTNASGQAQFWAEYQIENNPSFSYALDWGLLGGNQSISELQVDTLWSSTGFATDVVVPVPEPATAAFGFVTLLGLVIRRRRVVALA